MTYEELNMKYQALLSKVVHLRKENSELKKRLGIPNPEETTGDAERAAEQVSPSTVNKYSPSSEKIALFRSLFAGRDDVFARRWYSKTTGKSGYQPVCANEWDPGLCDKHTYKCAACPNRQLVPFNDEVIFSHLAGKDEYGRDVVGIYPMLTGETCRFLAADFDGKTFVEDVFAFRSICYEWNVPVSIERSRSGNGAHAWIIFDEPIPAVTARKLGTAILTAAMEKRGELSFKSYDRLFPNQDTMPSGGFGNLIALPLQGQARKSGNSVFVDESFEPYPDQWAYLSSVKKISKESVDDILARYGKKELGTLIKDSDEKPWEPVKKPSLDRFDFPQELKIVRADKLYVPRDDLSQSAINALKRLAAFKNPDFYRAQAMRMPIYDKPRIICCADLGDKFLALPRGCEEAFRDLLDKIDVTYVFTDQRNAGQTIPVSFNGALREEQKAAAEALLSNDIGVLSATTAFGKTVVAAYLIGQIKTNTLVLVHTQALLSQWKKTLETFLGFDVDPPEVNKGRGRKAVWSPVGTLGANKNTLHGIVDVAIIQSALSDGEAKEFVKDYGMVIVDECHHVSAVNFEKVLRETNAKYVYGLTATPTRHDGHHPIIFMQCGPIRYRVDAKEQAEKRPFDHVLIPRFTTFRTVTERTITTLYKELSENVMRNKQIVTDVCFALNSGRTPIVLTERREHVETLKDLLSVHCKNIITLVGTSSVKERRETMERLNTISEDEQLIIIATGRYVGEGLDYPRLDTLFLALPIAWKGKVAQYAGRLHRIYSGKTEAQIYDYVDIHVPMLERMYQKRVKGYAAIGYKTRSDVKAPASPDIIYDGRTFYPIYLSDISGSEKEILIVSPFMRKNRIIQMIKALAPRIVNGIEVTVVTRPPEDFKESERETIKQNAELLENCGIHIKYKSDFHQKFTIIDGLTVWYGSINFLSFGTHDESIMRFLNAEIAGALIDTII
ncbi:MAG: DEAD/DEAH box helicase family protein [Clostridia bacterium]|nr:DEAD/DEAH box helicase family protein [Clostridia bacterium]